MEKELESVFERVAQLPDDRQAYYIQLLLDELEAEAGWDERFANSPDVLERLANEARKEVQQGKVTELTSENIDDLL